MTDIQITEVALIIGFHIGELPVRYIGLLLIAKRLAHSECLPLMDRFKAKIGRWRGENVHIP